MGLQAQRAQLPSLKAAPGEAPEALSLGYLMTVLWLGAKLTTPEGAPLAKVESWVRLAGAADYALKRQALIEGGLKQLWDTLDASWRSRIAQRPGGLNARLLVSLTYLKDDAKPPQERRVVSTNYRLAILRTAWVLYGKTLWTSLTKFTNPPPIPQLEDVLTGLDCLVTAL